MKNTKAWIRDIQTRTDSQLKEIRDVQNSIRNLAWTILGSVVASALILVVMEVIK